MNKTDILKLHTSKEIIDAILKYPNVVDEEVFEYQRLVSIRE